MTRAVKIEVKVVKDHLKRTVFQNKVTIMIKIAIKVIQLLIKLKRENLIVVEVEVRGCLQVKKRTVIGMEISIKFKRNHLLKNKP